MTDHRAALAGVRYERAVECLDTARLVRDAGDYKTAANRSYYAIFHGIRAVLATEGVEKKKHTGNIAEFQRLFIKTEIFERRFSDIIMDAFEVRNECDYDDFYVIVKADVDEQIKGADEFLKAVETYLTNHSLAKRL